jgi:hypothetical protein
MTWNYRAVRYANGCIGLHEVFYDDAGKPMQRTEAAVGFAVDADETVEDLIRDLEMAIADLRRLPVLDDWEPVREIVTESSGDIFADLGIELDDADRAYLDQMVKVDTETR